MTTDVVHYEPDNSGSLQAISGGQLDNFMAWSKAIAVGSVIPDALRGKPADVLITVLHGLDLGLKPMQALNLVHVIKGRASLSAEGMRALLLQAGHEFKVVESTPERCVVAGRRKDSETWHESEFTIAQARKAKLAGANWDAYPEDMLLARATTRLCRRHFPDVTNGLPSSEELLDSQPTERRTLASVAAERDETIDAEIVDEDAQRADVMAAEADYIDPEVIAAEIAEAAEYEQAVLA